MKNGTRLLVGWLAATLSLLMIQGCATIGAPSTVAGSAIASKQANKERYKDLIEFTSHEYLRDHADSPCQEGEDDIIASLPGFIKEKGPKGIKKAIDRFEGIYKNEEAPDKVRASALYHIAVIHFRKKEHNPILGVEYLRKINTEFPGEYECIFADTPWRNKMIKKLHIPDELVEELKKERMQ